MSDADKKFWLSAKIWTLAKEIDQQEKALREIKGVIEKGEMSDKEQEEDLRSSIEPMEQDLEQMRRRFSELKAELAEVNRRLDEMDPEPPDM